MSGLEFKIAVVNSLGDRSLQTFRWVSSAVLASNQISRVLRSGPTGVRSFGGATILKLEQYRLSLVGGAGLRILPAQFARTLRAKAMAVHKKEIGPRRFSDYPLPRVADSAQDTDPGCSLGRWEAWRSIQPGVPSHNSAEPVLTAANYP
jgi:hypothetical protein